jgi:tetratricopeptide (TPR) repeat protein
VKRSLIIIAATAMLHAGTGRLARADYKQAFAYYQQQRYDKAIQELKPDLDQNPDWEFGHRLAGLSYLGLKNYALAVSSLSRAVQLKSTTASVYLGLGQAYFNMKRYDNAMQSLSQGEAFIKSADDRYKLNFLRASAHYSLNQFSEAANDFSAALREKGGASGDWILYSQLGISYFNLKKYDEAIQTLQKALALKPGQSATSEFLGKAYLKKGTAHLQAKQYDQAVDTLRKARDAGPKDGFVFYNLGEAYLFQKNYAEAERAYNQALELLPRSGEVFSRLGLVYEKQKKWDLSLSAYQKANELNSNQVLKDAIARVTEAKKQK